MSTTPIRTGIIGLGRGMSFAGTFEAAGMQLVAICDAREDALRETAGNLGVAAYTDYDRFIEHDMDAVILGNYFHQHAPFAIKALDAGLHVMSETAACKTPAEGVALARAVERSGKVYMLAENYAYFAYNQEMRRLYRLGEIGEVQYAEGEYNHPMNSRLYNQLAPGLEHWRNHIPPTYYCTHAMSPIMYVTGTRPTSVNGLSIPRMASDLEKLHVKRGDQGFVMICRMDNDAVARLMGLTMRGESIWYRFHGTRGLMENLRTGGDWGTLRIVHEEWDRREDDEAQKLYVPDFPVHAELAKQTGHGGGDFFMCLEFADAIRTGKPPYFDVYKGLDMTLVGIQGWKSCLANGAPQEIPDFRREEVRKRYERDDFSPYPEDRKPGQPLPSIKGAITPSDEAIAAAKSVWREMGYEGE
jgi:predicted dehydrogenase